MIPNYDAPRGCFEGLRRRLREFGYSEAGICNHLGLNFIHEFKAGATVRNKAEDGLALLIDLFLEGNAIPQTRLESVLGGDAFNQLEALNLVRRRVSCPELCYATAHLYPVEGLYVISDRTTTGDPEIHEPLPADAVYAAITDNTARFLSILPDEECEDCLDLCSGTGIAALVAASRHAKHAWATDLGERSVHFAEFNRRLNGLENITAAQGDLYEAIGGRTFDSIVAHPPYVPAKEQNLLFRDGGEDGERILRRIVEGLPAHLRPGGRFCCLTFATDREGAPLEQRVRTWLGDEEAEFDVALIEIEMKRKPEAVLRAVIEAKGQLGELGENSKLFEKLGVTALFYGVIAITRRCESRCTGTGRIRKAKEADREAIRWFCRWVADSAQPAFDERLLKATPGIAADMSLAVTHRVVDGALNPSEFRVRCDYPFVSDANVSPWLAAVIGYCNGVRSARDIYSEMLRQEAVADEMSPSEFAGYVKLLISKGFLEIPEYHLPVRTR